MSGGNRTRLRLTAVFAAFFILSLIPAPLDARMVAAEEAHRAAARLLDLENARPEQRLTQGSFQIAGVEPLLHRGRQVGYSVRLAPQGFMVLADITEVTPQVFVSFAGNLETLRGHPYFAAILNRLEYAKVHLRYLEGDAARPTDLGREEAPDAVQVNRNERAWTDILSEEALPAAWPEAGFAGAATEVQPLLTSKWDQDAPYWNYTPRVGGQATYTGCSATAMAQVMYYWKYPTRGQGSHAYQWKGQTLSADFDHPYNWSLMREDYSGGYSDAEADAVARLMSDVGIAIDMDYGVDGSGAWPNDNAAFPAFFKYSAEAHDVYRSGLPGWEAYFEVIRAQLDKHQPVVLVIYSPNSGHAVVADGYRTSPSNQAHINMGWSGSADAYYSLSNIYGFGDAEWDYAVVDIHPAEIKLTVKVTEGGTTDPPPGTYPFGYGTTQVVRVTALPAAHHRFIGWTGHASGLEPAVDVVVDMEKTVTANFQRIIYAPANATGQKNLNRSFSQSEYVNALSFDGHPDNVDIMGYRIYQVADGQRTQIAFLTGGSGAFQYLHRGISKDAAYTYHIAAINFDYREGDSAVVDIK